MAILYTLFILSSLFAVTTSFFRPEFAIVGLGLLFGVIFRRFFSVVTYFRAELIVIGLMFFSSSFGIAAQTLLGHEVIWRDLMIYTRLAFYASVIIFAALAAKNIKNYRIANLLLVVISSIIAILSIAQYFNFMNINNILTPGTGERYQWLREGIAWRRVTGTLDNPNYWGLAISIALSFVIYRILWQGRLLFLPIFFALAGSLFLTGSRTALVCSLGGVAAGAFLLWTYNKEKPRIIIAFTAFLFGITLIAATHVTKYYENEDRFSTKNIGTLYDRLHIWEATLESGFSNPVALVFGQGPRKGEIVGEDYVDNTYLRIWREFGFFGLGLFVALLIIMIRRTLRLIHETRKGTGDWSRGLLFLLIAWSIFGLAADSWYFVRTTTIILGLYVLIHSVSRNQNVSQLGTSTVGTSAGKHKQRPPLPSIKNEERNHNVTRTQARSR